MKKLLKRIKNEKGLTLVELLAVIVILAIVGTIAFVSIGNVIDNSRKDAVISNALQVVSAAKLAKVTNEELDFEAMTGIPINELSIEKMYDPWDSSKELQVRVRYGEVLGSDNKEFHVTIKSSKCNINDQPESALIAGKRDTLCESKSNLDDDPINEE